MYKKMGGASVLLRHFARMHERGSTARPSGLAGVR
jgi:hypothetical protein